MIDGLLSELSQKRLAEMKPMSFQTPFCRVASPCRRLTLDVLRFSPSRLLASVNLWPLTLQECHGGEKKHVLTVKQIPSLLLFSLLYKGQLFWPLQLHLIAVSICFLSLSWCLSVSLSVVSSFSPPVCADDSVPSMFTCLSLFVTPLFVFLWLIHSVS